MHADNWHLEDLEACPTNAAAVAAKGERVALSWYASAKDPPVVQLVFSSDGGATFNKQVQISTQMGADVHSLTGLLSPHYPCLLRGRVAASLSLCKLCRSSAGRRDLHRHQGS